MRPILINNLDITKSQETLSGEIAIHCFERLTDVCAQEGEGVQKVKYTITGSTSKFHLPSFLLEVDAVLPVICQRCLKEMSLPLSCAHDYVLSDSEPESFVGDDDVDWLEVSREMNLSELIEDELLMAMPLAPTHQHDCKPSKHESGEKHNPFAALKGLVK